MTIATRVKQTIKDNQTASLAAVAVVGVVAGAYLNARLSGPVDAARTINDFIDQARENGLSMYLLDSVQEAKYLSVK